MLKDVIKPHRWVRPIELTLRAQQRLHLMISHNQLNSKHHTTTPYSTNPLTLNLCYLFLSSKTKLKSSNRIVNVSLLFSSKRVPSSPGASLTSKRETRSGTTVLSSIFASSLPMQPYGPGGSLGQWRAACGEWKGQAKRKKGSDKLLVYHDRYRHEYFMGTAAAYLAKKEQSLLYRV